MKKGDMTSKVLLKLQYVAPYFSIHLRFGVVVKTGVF